MFLLERILCPVDFSPLSAKGLSYAASFATRYGARLYVLHVVDLTPLYGYAVEPAGLLASQVEEETEAAARERIARFASDGIREACPFETEIRKGKPFVEIIRFARERDVDLIVITTHGTGGFSRAILGSTTERVVRKSPCPVLTVRAVEHEFIA